MLVLPRGTPTSGLISPDGRWVLSLGWEGEARLHRASDGELRACFALAHPVEAWSFSPDGHHLAALSRERLRIYDLAADSSQETALAPFPLVPFALGPAPGQLTHAAQRGYLTVVDWRSWERQWSRLIGGEPLKSLGWDRFGRVLTGIDRSGKALAWEMPSARLLASYTGPAQAAASDVSELVAVRADGWGREVDLNSRKRHTFRLPAAPLALGPEGTSLMRGSGRLEVIRPNGSWTLCAQGPVRAVHLVGQRLMVLGAGLHSWGSQGIPELSRAEVSCLARNQHLLAWGRPGLVELDERAIEVGCTPRQLVFSTDGCYLALLDDGGELSFWSGELCTARREDCAALVQSGPRQVLVSKAGHLELRKLVGGQRLARLQVSFAPEILASTMDAVWVAARDEKVALGDEEACRHELTVEGNVSALAVEAHRWALGLEDGRVRLYQGTDLLWEERLECEPTALELCGDLLLAGGDDGRVWFFGGDGSRRGWLACLGDGQVCAGDGEGVETTPGAGRVLGYREGARFVPFEEGPPESEGVLKRLKAMLWEAKS